MKVTLRDEIKQTRPFHSLADEAYLNLLRTTDVLSRAHNDLLKEWGLTETQYNVLRILRGAGPEGRTCGEVGERLVTLDPDVTRLLDRLEKRGLLTRSRDERDRRVVVTRLSAQAEKILAQIDKPMIAITERLLGHLGPTRLKQLIRTLEDLRHPA